MSLNQIGLDAEDCLQVTSRLNRLLSDYQIHYQNLRGLHWNIRGKGFFTLHPLFEGYYIQTAERIDSIAERIISLGDTPLHSYRDYLDNSTISVCQNVSDAQSAVADIITDIGRLIKSQRELIIIASDIQDEVTADMMVGFTADDEKRVWMLSAFANR